MNCKLQPVPISTPVVKNKPPTFLVVKLLRIPPVPKNATPANAVFLPPIFRMSRAFASARKEMQAAVKLPTNERLAGVDTLSLTSAAWITPHE